jgi:hypothetical protein
VREFDPIVGPLRAHPVAFAVKGALVGAIFGLFSLAASSLIPRADRFLGWLAGGVIMGAVIGLGFPFFRRRIPAAVITGTSAAIALHAVKDLWRLEETLGAFPQMAVFAGVCVALIYGVLIWGYVEGDPRVRMSLWSPIGRELWRRYVLREPGLPPVKRNAWSRLRRKSGTS